MKEKISLVFCFCIFLSCSNREDINSTDQIFYKRASRLFNKNMMDKDSLIQAINLLDSAIYINKRLSKYYLTKYQIAIRLKRYDLAINSCNGILAFDRNSFVAIFQKGIAFDLDNNIDSAYRTKFNREIFKEYERILLYGLLNDSVSFNSQISQFKKKFNDDKEFSLYYQEVLQFNKSDYLTLYMYNEK